MVPSNRKLLQSRAAEFACAQFMYGSSNSLAAHQVTEDRAVLAEAEHALDLVEIDNDGSSFAFRINRTLLLGRKLEGAIPFRRPNA